MSWSFSVAGSPDDVHEKFRRELHNNAAHVPPKAYDKINAAANWLTHDAPENCTVVLSSAGHLNEDGTGNTSVSIEYKHCEKVADAGPVVEGGVPVSGTVKIGDAGLPEPM